MNQSELLACTLCDRPHGGPCPEPSPDRRIGQLVEGKYHILRRLACGGMGSVYEARHAVVGRHFALKFLHEQYAQKSCMVQRFLREAQAAGSIASEHIIGVLDYGTSDGTPYLVMELALGQDLREVLAKERRLAPDRAARIIIDACRGLELAHERGLVHRDLKPANICITTRSDGREIAKVIDFGVAKLRDGADLSEEGTLIGTVGYMAPEQLTDHKGLDGRADVYALGVILYQALAGRPPHLCDRSELFYRIVSVDPKPLDEISPGLPAGLSEVVARALCRSKERRYGSVGEFARALAAYADLETTPARNSSPSILPGHPALRSPELGTAETEIESAPTWVAVVSTPSPKSDVKGLHLPEMTGPEEFCRHPAGAAPMPVAPTREQHLSQRALVLSVGALALSVVAMTTMFIFVYSHGSGALEAAAHQGTSARAQKLGRTPVQAFGGARLDAPDPASAPLGAETVPKESCVKGDVLHRASVVELSPDGESGVLVQRNALRPAPDGSGCD